MNKKLVINNMEESVKKLANIIKNSNRQYRICIDSNIGGGKSTLLELLSKIPELNNLTEFLFEPVERWQNIGNYNLLELFYKDQQKYSYIFQTMTVITRMEMHDKANKEKFIIGERSWLTDKNVFVEQLYKDKMINDFEYHCYNEWFNYWSKKSKLDGILYIDTDPKECYRRKHELRKREEEESIPLSYLENLDNRHKEWLNNETIPIEKVDGNVNFKDNQQELSKIIDGIARLLQKIK